MPGPFYFAWTDYQSGAIPTFGPKHEVEDEQIVSFRVDGKEGDCCTLTMDVRNPKIGLLAPGRPLWAFLSYDTGTGGVVPLYFGRLVGVPTNILSEVVTLQFIAKPIDFNEQKFALAQTLMVLPWFDPLYVDPKLRPATNTSGQQIGDADCVLEAYTKLWYIDRLTLVMDTSDILLGEDGVGIFSGDEIPYDSVAIEIGQAPLTSVHVAMTADWSQAATGEIDFGQRWFQCPTGLSIASSWPKSGSQLAGGWSVIEGIAVDTWNVGGLQTFQKHFSFENKAKKHNVGDVMSTQLTFTEFPIGGETFISNVSTQTGSVPAATNFISYFDDGTAFNPYGGIESEDSSTAATPMHVSYNQVVIPSVLINTSLKLGYNAGGNRNETADFNLVADLQSIVTLPDPTDVGETLELNGSDVGLPIDGVIPIEDTTRNAYFPTDRGQLSLEYGLLRARAHMLMRARCVNLTWEVPFERAIQLTCRMNAQLSDSRIPGGTAQGKIIAYSFQCNVEEGIQSGTVTVGCAIGHGGTITTVAGDPGWVESGWVQTGWQAYTGAVTGTASGDVGYSIPVLTEGPLITTLTKDQVVVLEEVRSPDNADTGTDGFTDYVQVGSDTAKDGTTLRTFAKFPIMSYYLELLPVDNLAFDNLYDISTTPLIVPKMIDLESPTSL